MSQCPQGCGEQGAAPDELHAAQDKPASSMLVTINPHLRAHGHTAREHTGAKGKV